jgi:hypothetical protein
MVVRRWVHGVVLLNTAARPVSPQPAPSTFDFIRHSGCGIQTVPLHQRIRLERFCMHACTYGIHLPASITLWAPQQLEDDPLDCHFQATPGAWQVHRNVMGCMSVRYACKMQARCAGLKLAPDRFAQRCANIPPSHPPSLSL